MPPVVRIGEPTQDAPATPVGVEAELISDVRAIRPGDGFTVGLRVRVAPGWHTYWSNPGDAGVPLKVRWELPEECEAGAVQFPVPQRHADDGLVSFGIKGETLFLVPFTTTTGLVAGADLHVKAAALWLICNDSCQPRDAMLNLAVPVRALTEVADASTLAAFAEARARLPRVDTNWIFRAEISDDALRLHVTPPAGVGEAQVKGGTFFPGQRGLVALGDAVGWAWADGTGVMSFVRAEVAAAEGPLRGVFVIGGAAGAAPDALVVEAARVAR